MSDDIKKLHVKRGSLKSRLTAFNNFLTSLSDETKPATTSKTEMVNKLTRLKALDTEFQVLQTKIEEIAEDLALELAERERFEAQLDKLLSDGQDIIKSLEPSAVNTTSTSHSSIEASHASLIKLPTIELPKFDGSFSGWLEFRDIFQSLIHSNTNITDIQKLHYLRASVKGDAAKIISNLQLTSANYQVAWDLLCHRYENNRLLIKHHIKAIFNILPITKESSSHLRDLSDNLSKHLRILKQLEQPVDHWDALLIHIISEKFDQQTSREWEAVSYSESSLTISDLQGFLNKRAELLEKFEQNESASKPPQKYSFKVEQDSLSCKLCKGRHRLYACESFRKLPVQSRIAKAKQLKICLNCLQPNHTADACQNKGTCRNCSRRHNTLLHLTPNTNPQVSSSEQEVSLSIYDKETKEEVLLSTAIVTILGADGSPYNGRVLLDSGSQSNFITREFCQKLGLTTVPTSAHISGVDNVSLQVKDRCYVSMLSKHNSFKIDAYCYVLPTICSKLPSESVDRSKFKIPAHVKLADPSFYRPSTIDILLGARLFWRLISTGQIKVSSTVLQSTKFGWIISGPVGTKRVNKSYCGLTLDLEKQLGRFWEVEECTFENPWSQEEVFAEEHFKSTIQRSSEGRFIATIPFKTPLEQLGESKEQARRRFMSLERKLIRNPQLKQRYTQFMQDYIDTGHMSEIKSAVQQAHSYFLPHHGVVKEDSSTTKLRVVFDGSAKTSTGLSLNDLQVVGPTIQSDLFSILLRFRQHSYVISADIAKMYRQVLITKNQRSLQQIFWRLNQHEPLKIYTLNTVTYGTASASFMAIRCLHQLAIESTDQYPEAARKIMNDFYVDDLLTGAENIHDLRRLSLEIDQILKKGHFILRKWVSNEPVVLNNFESTSETVDLSSRENAKTLGLFWKVSADALCFKINAIDCRRSYTKRSILSDISQVFDPLGLLSPCVIIIKIIMQNLWLEKLSWDEKVPAHVLEKWSAFSKELPELNKLSINRHTICKNATCIELHGFSDASENAYGAAVYLRCIDKDGNIRVNLLCAKSKVAPLKTLSIPRLELCGALILSRLVRKIFSALTVSIRKTYLWTDSSIVLGWVNTAPTSLKTFVANRVAEIQTLTSPNDWRHVATASNPADLLSRGVSPTRLLTTNIWWHGPSWLSDSSSSWPASLVDKKQTLPELKNIIVHTFIAIQQDSFIIENYSSLSRLKRIVAYCLRFCNNCKNRLGNRTAGILTPLELDNALMILIKIIQRSEFKQEIASLEKRQTISPSSKILSLSPFVDESGILRVGGRLKNSTFSFEKRHQVLLPNHHLTKLILTNEHIRLMHAGPQHVLAAVRERFWPISGRNSARQIVRTCVRCFRARPKGLNPLMGNLPAARVTPSPPFYVTGIDYAGPFLIKTKNGRGSKTSKCYISIFVCFCTKAIHLELVSDLTKDAFIAAFRRFVSRRGCPSEIFSDNGTNFVGSNNELHQLASIISSNAEELSKKHENVSWHFIPPHSPHFGGLWEAGVKSVKHHLKRVIGNALLTFESFCTLLTQIEAILNSRPLSPLSSDPNDFEPLTPGHFLIGRSLTELPSPNVQHIRENRLDLYQRLQQLQQHFWERWSKEYLSELQQRRKWKQGSSIKLNDVVVIKEDNLPPLNWQLGRVVQLHPGADGVVRVVSLKTESGTTKRAVTKLCLLPQFE